MGQRPLRGWLEASLRHMRAGLRPERGAKSVNLRPERTYVKLGMANLRPVRANLRLWSI